MLRVGVRRVGVLRVGARRVGVGVELRVLVGVLRVGVLRVGAERVGALLVLRVGPLDALRWAFATSANTRRARGRRARLVLNCIM